MSAVLGVLAGVAVLLVLLAVATLMPRFDRWWDTLRFKRRQRPKLTVPYDPLAPTSFHDVVPYGKRIVPLESGGAFVAADRYIEAERAERAQRYVDGLPEGKATMSGYFGVDPKPHMPATGDVIKSYNVAGRRDGRWLVTDVRTNQHGYDASLEWIGPLEDEQ